MRSSIRSFSVVALTAFIALVSLGGCSEIGEAIDCEQMCDELRTCIDGDLDENRCQDRCEDKADHDGLRKALDDCTDCLDHDYACAEVPEHCQACQVVTDALL
jgi:hypothetical protein